MNHAIPVPPAPGALRWSPLKTLEWAIPTLGFLIFGPATAGVDTALLLVGLIVLILGVGHVVGVHRGLIHRSWRTWPWLERGLVWLGSLAGMTGLFDLLAQHDVRDHWQNQLRAPAVYAYAHGLATDFWWYLHCTWTPPHDGPLGYQPPRRDDIHGVAFYAWLQRTWRIQQLVFAGVLFALGGWPWVVWGALGRLAITRNGFWLANYVSHTSGTVEQQIDGSGEVGRNNALFGVISFGESWHNNHHVWPRSAQVGVHWYQADFGWRVIQCLQVLGMAWDVLDVDTAARRPAPPVGRAA